MVPFDWVQWFYRSIPWRFRLLEASWTMQHHYLKVKKTIPIIALTKCHISSEPPMFIHFQGAMSDERITPVAGVVMNPVTHLRQLMGVITPFITCSYYLVILVILSLWPFRYRSQQQSHSAVSVENSKTQGLNKCKCRRSNHFKLTLTEEYSLEI